MIKNLILTCLLTISCVVCSEERPYPLSIIPYYGKIINYSNGYKEFNGIVTKTYITYNVPYNKYDDIYAFINYPVYKNFEYNPNNCNSEDEAIINECLKSNNFLYLDELECINIPVSFSKIIDLCYYKCNSEHTYNYFVENTNNMSIFINNKCHFTLNDILYGLGTSIDSNQTLVAIITTIVAILIIILICCCCCCSV